MATELKTPHKILMGKTPHNLIPPNNRVAVGAASGINVYGHFSSRKEQWQCNDGNCISVDSICDGGTDCPDGSDEVHALCRKMRCPSNLFRCTYGACVSGNAPCNGRVDCADASDELSPICRTNSDEINGQYKCINGQLIPAEKRCDGIQDCSDGSDETVRSCAAMSCLPYLFQCAYGACADQGAECNGRNDCADGSDESSLLCGKTTPKTIPNTTKSINTPKATTPKTTTRSTATTNNVKSKCKLPDYPQHGTYIVVGTPNAVPGQILNKPILEVTSQCKMINNPTVSYQCNIVYGNNTKSSWPCREYELEGTSAVATCKQNYHLKDVAPKAKCVDGQWEKLIKCVPECGTIVPKSTALVIGGHVAERGELSWHAGIYTGARQYEQICGGSLIRRSTIVSAAHCFYDDNKEGMKSAKNFAAAVGKIYRAWNDPRDRDPQKRYVKELHIPETYKGSENNYQDDIALVIVDQPFTYTSYIRPVCLDFRTDFEMEQLRPGNMGKVAGWGMKDTSGHASDVLKVVELPVVEFNVCWERAPFEFKSHITSNKFCAGYYNGTALCKGDSGGGLSFSATEFGVIRYYLRGIVSTSPAASDQDLCNALTVTTFTKVTLQEAFFSDYLHEEY
ncbi:modular serine protease-like [Papilio machaon]|uniref:modular serine protease-like n=1 Tax=Papilio machaon TaxID=76193 RepID=UPI001E663D51|nr:modular serine protease-like [Papilio machaon]